MNIRKKNKTKIGYTCCSVYLCGTEILLILTAEFLLLNFKALYIITFTEAVNCCSFPEIVRNIVLFSQAIATCQGLEIALYQKFPVPFSGISDDILSEVYVMFC